MPIRFDKLLFVKTLKESGQAEEQAEALANALDKALEQSQGQLLTKAEFETRIAQMETRLTEAIYKVAGFIIMGVGAVLGVFKFFD